MLLSYDPATSFFRMKTSLPWRNHYSHASGDLHKNAYDTANTKQKQPHFTQRSFFTVEGSFQIYLPNIGASKLKGSEVFLARDHLCP